MATKPKTPAQSKTLDKKTVPVKTPHKTDTQSAREEGQSCACEGCEGR